MVRLRFLSLALLALMLAGLLGIATTCGGGKPSDADLHSSQGASPVVDKLDKPGATARSLGQVLMAIEQAEVPNSVSPSVWQELTGELARILKARHVSKVAAIPPDGEYAP